jgi:signal transduction histidine kinase
VIRWWPDRVPLRLRVFFRGAFLLLALATVGLALTELREEKQQSYQNYRNVFDKNVEQISARLQHPSGQLALLNPALPGAALTPLRPLLLPFSAIDFDDKAKAQQAAEMAGCLVQYPNHAQLCVSVGNNPAAGAFIYAVGTFASRELVTHTIGDLDLSHAHRLLVDVSMRGRSYQWLAPLEPESTHGQSGFRGRLTGFVADSPGHYAGRPDKDFRGWLWQDGRCLLDAVAANAEDCLKRSFFSVRLPIGLFRQELLDSPKIVWPPKDLAEIRVRVQAYAPGNDQPLFDSNRPGASAPFALADLSAQLLAGETLRIRKLDGQAGSEIMVLPKRDDTVAEQSPVLIGIIQRLKVDGAGQPRAARRVITTPVGDYEVLLTGDLHSVDRAIGLMAGRLSWFVAAILLAILITWIGIELRIIRRITLLTRRAASVKRSVNASEGLQIELQDLRGGDELGLLASVLAELLQRVNEDSKREQIRIEQEKDMWHAIGHEIMAPLQSLAALHATLEDPSQHYIQRMRQAVRVLYGSASPSEAILSATLQVSTLDICAFLRTVADNAVHAGIERVEFDGPADPVIVKAEENSLEDVITHILSNANRYRHRDSAIRVSLRSSGDTAEVRIYNRGSPIDAAILDRVFEYGVSDAQSGASQDHRGQGLYVARTYMAKMGGTVEARNSADGVEFVLTLALVLRVS